MSEPAESSAPEWRIVQVLPSDEGNALNVAVAAYLNDNNPRSRRVLEQLGRAVSRVLRERGVRVPAAGSAPEGKPSADRPKV
jgi:hypothetical protein